LCRLRHRDGNAGIDRVAGHSLRVECTASDVRARESSGRNGVGMVAGSRRSLSAAPSKIARWCSTSSTASTRRIRRR
jgi:hypothetical protein